jgi:hypothetical protein
MDLKNKLFVRFLEESASGGQLPWGQRLTPEQQAYARKTWHKFVATRQAVALCIQCNRRHQPGMQRCGMHRNLNKAKCLAWARLNRENIRQQYRKRVAARVCVNNPDHGRSFGSHIKCEPCYNHNKLNKQTRQILTNQRKTKQ